MDTQVLELVKRHGGHHGKRHVRAANSFVFIVLGLMCLYVSLEALNANYRRLPKALKVIKSPYFVSVAWAAMMIYGIFLHFKSDIIQLARRFGQLAIAASTLSIIFSFKPALFPFTSQVNLVPIHKWVGRTSVVCALFHGIVYFVSYARRELAASHSHSHSDSHSHEKRHGGGHHKLFSFLNILGMISVLGYLVIFVSSLGRVRRRAYYLFYALHRPLVIVIYVSMIWHARPKSWLLVPMGLCFLGAQIAVRVFMHKNVQVTKVESFGPSLKRITFEPPLTGRPTGHIRLTLPFSNPKVFFMPSHPYTLVGRDQLIVRESRFKIEEGRTYSLYGPFSSTFDSANYTHILAFAGGSGVSLLPNLNNIAENQRLIWITKSGLETPILADYELKNCEVYISNSSSTPRDRHNHAHAEDFELQEFEIDSDAENYDEEQNIGSEPLGPSGSTKLEQFKGRPNFDKVANAFFDLNAEDDCRLLVVTCGPQSLVDAVTLWANSRDFDIWTEVFAL